MIVRGLRLVEGNTNSWARGNKLILTSTKTRIASSFFPTDFFAGLKIRVYRESRNIVIVQHTSVVFTDQYLVVTM